MYHIGKITNTHGIKGEVKIYNLSDFNRFLINAKIYVTIKGVKTFFTIERVRPQGNLFIVKFEGFNNINDILFLKGLDVYTDEDPDDLEEDDFHYSDLVDKKVYTENDEFVGKVISLIEVPQGHLLEIETTVGKKKLIPFVDAFIKEISEEK